MATSVAMTDAIPLLAANGVDGQNNARDMRMGLLGALALAAPGGGGVGQVRPGVMPQTWSGSQFLDLLVSPKATPSQQIDVSPGAFLCQRAGFGPYLGWSEGTLTMTADAADATNPRRDILWARVYDVQGGSGDPAGTHGPFLGITNGTPSGTPVDPTALPAGAVPLARLIRPANTNAISTVQPIRRGAGFGAAWQMLEGDTLAGLGASPGELRYRTTGAVAQLLDMWGKDNTWHGMFPGYVYNNGQFVYNNANTESATPGVITLNTAGGTKIARVDVADPGVPYVVELSGQCEVGNNGVSGRRWDIEFRQDAIGNTAGPIGLGGPGSSVTGNGTSGQTGAQLVQVVSAYSGVLTGAHTFYLVGFLAAGSTGNGFVSQYNRYLSAKLIPQ